MLKAIRMFGWNEMRSVGETFIYIELLGHTYYCMVLVDILETARSYANLALL